MRDLSAGYGEVRVPGKVWGCMSAISEMPTSQIRELHMGNTFAQPACLELGCTHGHTIPAILPRICKTLLMLSS